MKSTTLSFTLLCSLSLLLTACGGGGSSSITGAATGDKFNGIWQGACEYNATTNTGEKSKTTFNGATNKLFVSTYNTSDCSGTALKTDEATFDIKYQGALATSTCTAEKADLQLTAAKINGRILSKEQIAVVNNSNLYPKYQLICIDSKDKLRKGDTSKASTNGTTAAKRPTEMDMSGAGFTKQ